VASPRIPSEIRLLPLEWHARPNFWGGARGRDLARCRASRLRRASPSPAPGDRSRSAIHRSFDAVLRREPSAADDVESRDVGIPRRGGAAVDCCAFERRISVEADRIDLQGAAKRRARSRECSCSERGRGHRAAPEYRTGMPLPVGVGVIPMGILGRRPRTKPSFPRRSSRGDLLAPADEVIDPVGRAPLLHQPVMETSRRRRRLSLRNQRGISARTPRRQPRFRKLRRTTPRAVTAECCGSCPGVLSSS